jgi:hypothetical protein
MLANMSTVGLEPVLGLGGIFFLMGSGKGALAAALHF